MHAALVLILTVVLANLLVLTWIDLRGMVLPDALVLLLAVLGIAFHLLTDWAHVAPIDALAGAALGAGVLHALRAAFFRLRGVEALGLGDVKLMAAAGLWVGVWNVPLVLTLAAVATLAVVLGLALLRRVTRREATVPSDAAAVPLRTQQVPFGPGLCLGLAVVVAQRFLLS